MTAVFAKLDHAKGTLESPAVTSHARTRRKRQAARGRKPAGHDRNALGVVELETRFGMRQRHHAFAEPEPAIEHFGDAGALRRAVVEEHHTLGDGHRASRPGEDHVTVDQLRDAEEPHAIQQRGDMTAGDGQGCALAQHPGDLFAMVRHGLALQGTPSYFELSMDTRALPEVVVVQLADGRQGRSTLLGQDLGRGLALENYVVCFEFMLEPYAVEVLLVPQHGLLLAMRGVQRRVAREDILGTLMKPKVDRGAAEVRVQVLVFAFALLPACSDGRDRTLDAEFMDGLAKSGIEALSAEQHDGSRRTGRFHATRGLYYVATITGKRTNAGLRPRPHTSWPPWECQRWHSRLTDCQMLRQKATTMTPADATLLLVEDDRSNLESLERLFSRDGYRVLTTSDAKSALEMLRKHRVHVVVTDLMMPGLSGMDLLKAIKTITPETEVVMMTAYGTVETAVEAMRAGAYDFVEKPLKRMQITKTVAKAIEKASLIAENKTLREEISQLKKREIIGSSPALRQVLEVAAQAAPSSATVLILGENGTGKELLARYIHARSARAQGPFVAVNCAAIPETILEAELFGYERGAFTGATTRREGRFAQARGGTLFLDEVGDLSPAVQVKFLRVLQEGEFEPLGGRTTRADVRIIAATNRDLAHEVAAGRFREDLYYRLNVIAVTCPPLRARQGDVPLLVDHFLQVFGKRNNKGPFVISQAALEKLSEYTWPGNVRELENTIERAVVLAKSNQLDVGDLPKQISEHERARSEIVVPLGTPLEEIERRVIRETLRATNGDKRLTAQLLGIATRTIYRKLAEEREAAGLPAESPPPEDERDTE